MKETILNALERSTETRRFKESGFIPGVLYGDNILKSVPVKFETSALTKVLAQHGSNAKVWVNHGEHKDFGFIKEIQRNTLTGQVSHIDVHFVSQNQEMKMHLPISFKGRDILEHKILSLQVYKSEIEVTGKASLIPELAVVDVSEKQLGDTITIDDFCLDKKLTVSDDSDAVYGIITPLRGESVEEPGEDEAALLA